MNVEHIRSQIKSFYEKHGFGVIAGVLVFIFVAAIGYALLSDTSFTVSQEPLDQETQSNFIADLHHVPVEG